MKLLPILLISMFVTSATAQNTCPVLEVVGPSGLTSPGELAIFSLKPDLPNLDKLKLKWDVSLGTIEEGQGTAKISARAETDKPIASISATVTVSGLPEGCTNAASETVGVAAIIDIFPLDEFGVLPSHERRGRMDIALASIAELPNFHLIFILRTAPRESKVSVAGRKKQILDHLRIRKFHQAHRIRIIERPGEYSYTQVYKLHASDIDSFIETLP